MAWNGFRTATTTVLLVFLTNPLLAQNQNYQRPLAQGAVNPQNNVRRDDRSGAVYSQDRNSNFRGAPQSNGQQNYQPQNSGPPNRGTGINGVRQGNGRQPTTGQASTGNVPRIRIPAGQPPRSAQAPRIPRPDWAEKLTPKHVEHLHAILNYWEYTSSKIETYRCAFQRWEYDTVFGPKGDCKTFSTGELKYANPDKGLFRVDKVLTYQPSQEKGGQAKHVQLPDVMGEHWICDGANVFEHDYTNKKLIQRELPKEMRGTAITNGPLPFMFGAKKDEILAKYWIRVITPASVRQKKEDEQQYWLEAYPKRADDATNFLKVHIIIDRKSYLPQGMVIFDRGYQPPFNESRTVFSFSQRKINFDKNILGIFMRDFANPKLPSGWQRVPIPANGMQPRNARVPARGPRREVPR